MKWEQCYWKFDFDLLYIARRETFLRFVMGEIRNVYLSSSQTVDLDFLYFTFYFYFIFYFFFYFLFLEQLELGLIDHADILVIIWWHSHKTDHETWENLIEDFKNKWCHTTWTPHVDLMDYTWWFRVGCTVVSMDHL